MKVLKQGKSDYNSAKGALHSESLSSPQVDIPARAQSKSDVVSIFFACTVE